MHTPIRSFVTVAITCLLGTVLVAGTSSAQEAPASSSGVTPKIIPAEPGYVSVDFSSFYNPTPCSLNFCTLDADARAVLSSWAYSDLHIHFEWTVNGSYAYSTDTTCYSTTYCTRYSNGYFTTYLPGFPPEVCVRASASYSGGTYSGSTSSTKCRRPAAIA